MWLLIQNKTEHNYIRTPCVKCNPVWHSPKFTSISLRRKYFGLKLSILTLKTFLMLILNTYSMLKTCHQILISESRLDGSWWWNVTSTLWWDDEDPSLTKSLPSILLKHETEDDLLLGAMRLIKRNMLASRRTRCRRTHRWCYLVTIIISLPHTTNALI